MTQLIAIWRDSTCWGEMLEITLTVTLSQNLTLPPGQLNKKNHNIAVFQRKFRSYPTEDLTPLDFIPF